MRNCAIRAGLSLMKLGFIIQRNPTAEISIEGHTDTFGGDEYNQSLSLSRAEAVKAWLIGRPSTSPLNGSAPAAGARAASSSAAAPWISRQKPSRGNRHPPAPLARAVADDGAGPT